MSNFATRLRQQELLFGTLLTLPSPEIAEMLAKCDFDWLFFDGEHSPTSLLDWQRMMQAVGGRSACILRVACLSEVDIKMALDIGADGIIVPRINTPEQARNAVAWCRYPPQGSRSIGLARAHGYGLTFSEYLERANRDIALILQIESIEAVENIEAIAAVEGVDALFIGPYDLSASMGKIGELDDAEVRAVIKRITTVCKQHNMPLGYFGVSAESAKPYIEDGYSLICAGTDAGFVTRGGLDTIGKLKS